METTNDIYQHTRSSLMTIVSANVADHTLESVMTASGLTQDTVSADHMMKLIRGPIYREFQTIVPKEGLKKQLSKLLIELQNVEQEPAFGLAGISKVPKSAESLKQQQSSSESQITTKRANKQVSKKAVQARIPGITKIRPNAIGVPRAYFRDPRDDAFNIQMPLFGTDPHVVLDNGTRAVVRYWISQVTFLDAEELERAGLSRFSFVLEEESHSNPTIVRLLEMLREEEEAEQESLMLERLAEEAKAAAERDIAEQEAAKANAAPVVIEITQKDIEDLVDDYVELDNVRYIAILGHDGEVVKTKGRGLEINKFKTPLLESMGRLSLESFQTNHPTKQGQFSSCKSIFMQYQSGVLFVLSYDDVYVVLYGSEELNTGLLYSYAARIGMLRDDEDDVETLTRLNNLSIKEAKETA